MHIFLLKNVTTEQRRLVSGIKQTKMDSAVMVVAINGIVWPSFVVMVVAYAYFNHRTKVRMALIQSGRDASIFQGGAQAQRLRTLKYGVSLLMAGVGLMFGGLFAALGMDEDVAYFAGLFSFTGLGLVAYYLYVSQQIKIETIDSDLL
jgi:hypothetical protein